MKLQHAIRPQLFILFLLFSCNIINAQVDFKIAVGPQWSNAYSTTAWDYKVDYSFKTGFQVNGLMLFNQDKRLQPYTGFGVNTFGTKLKNDLVFYSDLLSGMNIEEGELSKLKLTSTFLIIELPVGFHYYFKEQSRGLFLDFSLKPNYLITEFVRTKISPPEGESRIRKSRGNNFFKRFNLGIRPGIGFEFEKFKNLSITAYGVFQMLNLATNGFKYYQYGFGLAIGMRI